ncbi:unnamed protein product [Effrenium voratum]|nr:unnamed protein product [Effrenium voratum]|mmetsp:Transcript_28181/g.66971  ORF Transcript_28181/g.66971 Transcript_28181/m.66971 type:complete len:536 (-) Transcript_28181:199-1806(-)|eukprot:CAMPEP_0181410824 /NCGR_PEP_ID=MMETSP1110-20121109/7542_1 /TAXON_ID=174948 /ORGANISM="Symbiodinium sp., Strain CCMP421" /LENGTH=535 /DNA_ID=CAMNT_0023533391 /DNA_START=30 /DNA_END=1637 /DNA_ORIENTATION=-
MDPVLEAEPGPLPPGAQPVGSLAAGTQEKVAGGPVSNPLALRHERLQGKVSKYVVQTGAGFVKSHLFDGELGFKTENVMLECQNYEFKEDENVEFDVQADERGRPQATALKPIVGRKPSDCLGQRHRGYVRRFADRWGFLNAAAFDGDLFVHRDNLLLVPDQIQDGQPPLRTGQAVEFDVALDDRGRTVAKQITTSALLRPCDWIGRRLQGVIRSFQGAWGFVNSDKFAGDLFVHRDALLQQFQDAELTAGTVVEFDVERDHHKKSGKNRLVARQVAVLHPALAPSFGYAVPHQVGMDAAYGMYGAQVAQSYQPPLYYQGASPMAEQYAFGQAPFSYDPYAQHGMMHLSHQPINHSLPTQFVTSPATAQAQSPTQPATLQPPFQAPFNQGGGPSPAQPPDGESEGAQVLLHITTHDWEPDQTGQLRVRKGTLVNVSHRAAHGWVYAATVKHGDAISEDASEGWVPQAVAKRVSLCRVAHDWPEEGAGTLGLVKGDLIAVSKEADRGWVYGERISPKRQDPTDGWLPKKVLEYILV